MVERIQLVNKIEENLEPIGEKVPLLDSGYCQVIEYWGCDARVVEAARMSTGKGFEGWGPVGCDRCMGFGLSTPEGRVFIEPPPPQCLKCKGTGQLQGDEKLLHYLYSNKHATPFEMAGMVIEVQAPIMVFREWHRHRTQSYNEMSARYVPLPDVNYLPTPERCLTVSGGNKQASGIVGADELTHEKVILWLANLEEIYIECETVYQYGLKQGIPKELARLCVPVGRYSRMRASTNLRNWLAFLTLRMDTNAQWEIRQYANEVGRLISMLYPRTWELFVEGKR